MARRNPNGYGSVTKLKGNRSRPYVIKVTTYDEDGHGRQVPVDYAATREEANIILAKYNDNPWNIDRNRVTLADLYTRWLEIKGPKLGTSRLYTLKAAYKHCQKLYGMKYRQIKAYQMQETIDNCERSYATQAHIKVLWGHLDSFAFELDIIDKMYSQLTSVSAKQEESKRAPFTEKEVEALWKISDQKNVDIVLIYIYTGFRLMELLDMTCDQVNLEEQYFKGGSKSDSGKNRIVPIHPRIMPFVKKRLEKSNEYFLENDEGSKFKKWDFYEEWKVVIAYITKKKKTPHEARHTFETFLDNAGGNRKCIDMLMGHKSKDIGNRVYNHKTVKQLRETILLLK